MLSGKHESKNIPESDKQKLRISEKDNHLSDNLVQLAGTEDSEYFLRKAFLRDEWEGCSLVFEHYYEPLCSHAVRFVYSKVYAEDIVSEVFLSFWQKRHFRRINTTYRTYLFQAVRNQALNFIRKEFSKDVYSLEDQNILSRSISPDEQMMYDQFYQKVQKGIDRLPPKCKNIFLMSRFEDKSSYEIASIQGISISTVENHINKALKIMGEALDYMYE